MTEGPASIELMPDGEQYVAKYYGCEPPVSEFGDSHSEAIRNLADAVELAEGEDTLRPEDMPDLGREPLPDRDEDKESLDADVRLTYAEGYGFSARHVPSGVASQGETEAEALRALAEALTLHRRESRNQPKPDRVLTSECEALAEVAERSGMTVEELVALREEMGLEDPRDE